MRRAGYSYFPKVNKNGQLPFTGFRGTLNVADSLSAIEILF